VIDTTKTTQFEREYTKEDQGHSKWSIRLVLDATNVEYGYRQRGVTSRGLV